MGKWGWSWSGRLGGSRLIESNKSDRSQRIELALSLSFDVG